jgi:hypothetical protein
MERSTVMAGDEVDVSVEFVSIDDEAAIVIADCNADEELLQATERPDTGQSVFQSGAFKGLGHRPKHLLVLDNRVAVSDHVERLLHAVLIDGSESFEVLDCIIASGDVEGLLVYDW